MPKLSRSHYEMVIDVIAEFVQGLSRRFQREDAGFSRGHFYRALLQRIEYDRIEYRNQEPIYDNRPQS